MKLNAFTLAALIGFATPVIVDLLIPSEVVAIPQFPTGTFGDADWSVSLSYNNNTYYYRGENKQSGNALNLSGAQLGGSSERPVFTWRNGAYRYQVTWQPNDPNFVRLQVFAPNGSEILNRLLTRTSAPVATQTRPRPSSPAPQPTTARNSSLVNAWRNAQILRTIEDRTVYGKLVRIFDVALSQDGQTVVSGGNDDYTKVWDISSGNEVNRFKFNEAETGGLRRTYFITSVVISPNNQYLISGSRNMVEVRQFPRGDLLYRQSDTGSNVVILPDSQSFITGLVDSRLKVWNLRSGDLQEQLPDFIQQNVSLSVSPDGQYLVGGGGFGKMNIWNLRNGNLVRILKHTDSDTIIATAMSPDRNLIFTGQENNPTVRVWSVQTGNVVRTLQGHSGQVNAISISPDGQILATGSEDGTIRLMNLQTRELIRVLRNNAGEVLSLDFSADGRTLASSTREGKIVIWQANSN